LIVWCKKAVGKPSSFFMSEKIALQPQSREKGREVKESDLETPGFLFLERAGFKIKPLSKEEMRPQNYEAIKQVNGHEIRIEVSIYYQRGKEAGAYYNAKIGVADFNFSAFNYDYNYGELVDQVANAELVAHYEVPIELVSAQEDEQGEQIEAQYRQWRDSK